MTQLDTIHGRGATHLSAPQKALAVLLSIVLAVGLSPLGQAPSKAYAEGGDLQAASTDDGLQAQAGATVAKIGNTEYASVREAVAAASNGDTITLVANDRVSFSASAPNLVIEGGKISPSRAPSARMESPSTASTA